MTNESLKKNHGLVLYLTFSFESYLQKTQNFSGPNKSVTITFFTKSFLDEG